MTDHEQLGSRVSGRHFELLINSVVDYAIYMLDPEGYVVSWNPGAKRFKGYQAEEIIGQHYSRFFTAEDRAANLPGKALRTAASEGRFETEGWRVRKDGSRFWASAVLDAIRDDTGQLIGFAKITRDITEKKEVERTLFESEQRFRLLVQGVRDYAIYMLDPEGRVANWNAGAELIKGYSAEEIVGEHFSRFYTPEDRERGEPARALGTALAQGKFETQAWRMRKDGSRFWAHVVIDPIHDDTGHHLGFAKITRDVTQLREAQLELEEARTALFQSQKLQALGELTGGIAHDFNNLMTVIRGSADLLRKGGLTPEKRARYLDAIMETADRASTLTSHLLAFGRRQAVKPEIVDLNVRLDAFAEVVGRTIGSQIGVTLELAPDLWPTEVDSTQLETALLNAAINARDAMPDGGELTISTFNVPDRRGDMVCVSLADDGEGMPEEVASRAFEPFFTTKPVGKGTGLGLSQIHGFAAQAGGRAEISSKPGAGTTVSLYLPRADKPATAAASDDGPVAGGEGRTVLLVEDNEQVREFAESLLMDLQYKVVAAASADEALRLLERTDVDLVFSDIVMPGRSGIELAEEVSRKYPRLPVVLATGYSEEVSEGAARQFELLSKPYGAQSLSAALSTAFNALQAR